MLQHFRSWLPARVASARRTRLAVERLDDRIVPNAAPITPNLTLDTQGAKIQFAPPATDPDGDPLTLTVGTPTFGTVVGEGGTFVYTPPTGGTTFGIASFPYTADDGHGGTATGAIRVAVTRDPVRANDFDVYAHAGTSVSVELDLGGTLAAVALDSADGTAAWPDPAGRVLTFAPAAAATGDVAFTYTAVEDDGKAVAGTVYVHYLNTPPTAYGGTFAAHAGSTLVIGVGVLATDPDGDPLAVTNLGTTFHGTANYDPALGVSYSPSFGFVGTESFPFTVADGLGGTSTGGITVVYSNADPEGKDYAFRIARDTSVSGNLLDGASDADNDTLTAQAAPGPYQGTIALDPDGSFTYTPAAGFLGSEAVQFVISDGVGGSTIRVAYFRVYGPTPVVADDRLTTVHDRQFNAGVLANDAGADDPSFGIVIVTPPQHGKLGGGQAMDDPNSMLYTPDAGYVGTDSFTYKLSDGVGESGIATATITVTNGTPVGGTDSYTTGEDQRLTIAGGEPGTAMTPPSPNQPLLANDSDGDGDITRVLPVSSTSHGSLVLNDDGSFIYTPAPNYHGTDQFTYRLSDSVSYSAAITATIVVVPSNALDIDGKDTTTAGAWMSEPDEARYGLCASVYSSPSTILLRDPIAPAGTGWQVVERLVKWDEAILSVSGATMPGEMLLPSSGDCTASVGADVADYDPTLIAYSVKWYNTITGELRFQFVNMQVVDEKAILTSLEFTSDHNVLLNNTGDWTTKDSPRYDPVEYVQATGYNAPISHTRGKKVELKLEYNLAGMAALGTLKLVGTSPENGLKFESGVFAAVNGNWFIPTTATNELGQEIRTIDAGIDWKLVLNPGAANEKSLALGNSGAHKIFVTYGTPLNPGGKDELKPTTYRMAIATDKLHTAYLKAKTNLAAMTPPNLGDPKPARLVYELLQLHQFNLSVCPVKEGIAVAWRVPETWTKPWDPAINPLRGSDCISGAMFTTFACQVQGISGVEYKLFVSKGPSDPDAKTAIEYPGERNRPGANPGEQPLMMADSLGRPNSFEATVIYTSGNKTLYMPSGAGARLYGKADDVLAGIFTKIGWWKAVDDPVNVGKRMWKLDDVNVTYTWDAMNKPTNLLNTTPNPLDS